MGIGTRSWASARTPHSERPTKSTVVSIVMTSSSGPSVTWSTPEAVESQQSLGQPDTVVHGQGSSRCSLRTAATMAGDHPDRVRGPSGQLPRLTAPDWNAKSHYSVGEDGIRIHDPPACKAGSGGRATRAGFVKSLANGDSLIATTGQ